MAEWSANDGHALELTSVEFGDSQEHTRDESLYVVCFRCMLPLEISFPVISFTRSVPYIRSEAKPERASGVRLRGR
jgi:hypothetical protein